MNGKGDKRRPADVDKDTFDSNWDKIFNKKKSEMWEHNCNIMVCILQIWANRVTGVE